MPLGRHATTTVPREESTLDIGIDLGTANVLVWVKGRGIVVNEPSVVAINATTHEVLRVGNEARKMVGRTPANIVAVRPMREGVISDFQTTQKMLSYFLKRVTGGRMMLHPRVAISVPPTSTEVERKAVVEAAEQCGARPVYLVPEPKAAALGCGIDFDSPHGVMVINIGGGTTDIAVLSLGGVVETTSIRVAGDAFDSAIVRWVREHFNLLIGERTAEEVKIAIGACQPGMRNDQLQIRGRDLVSGMPKNATLTSDQVAEAIGGEVREIVRTVHEVLAATPPELAADILDRGIVLTGGGALLYGWDQLIAQQLGVAAYLADHPLEAVALGLGKALERLGTSPLTTPHGNML
ncbi:MAG: rod shape-determining protein [Firmicutes bacterium]|nr:rod shape-determining protein [Bacillota bacterium]